MKSVCLIPARGSSVRIPRKNVKMFHGKPIIAYSIDNALKSGLFDAVIVSTDDFDIANTAADYGARYVMRDYDDGSKGTQEVATDFLNSKAGQEFGMCCVLYPCASLLTWRDIVKGWSQHISSGQLYAYSVKAAPLYLMDRYPPEPEDIGGFYIGFAQAFREGVPLDGNASPVEIDPERCCDINTIEDFSRAERMYEELHRGD